MNSRERVLAVIDHRELDRIPFDHDKAVVIDIHVKAYQVLYHYLGV